MQRENKASSTIGTILGPDVAMLKVKGLHILFFLEQGLDLLRVGAALFLREGC